VNETIIRAETIYEGRVIRLALLDIQLPDGRLAKREAVQHPGAVAVVALDSEQHILLVRQFRTAAERVLLEIPAGTLEPGESPTACAERELQEETGFHPGRLEPIGGIYVAPSYTSEFIHLFLATDLTASRLESDADEFIEVERVPLTEALAMIERGDIVDGKSIAGMLRVARKLGV
jgi:ADP-ribose pyrophosphatase